MAQGIVGKIWNIKAGSQGRPSSAQIEDSIEYITDDEKCDVKIGGEESLQIGRGLTYITNDVKTLKGLYVGVRHITDISDAMNEMMEVKEFYGKTGGRIALHGIVSLSCEESDPGNAGKLMLLLNDLMQEIFPQNQVVYAVHSNTENLHIHFIANTVGLDGKKIHMDKSFMRKIFEPALNKLAITYGFTPNKAWPEETRKDRMPIAERKIQLRQMIDLAIEESEDFGGFLEKLRENDLTANVGKHLSLQLPDMSRRMRSYQLGSAYTVERIVDRISSKRDTFQKPEVKTHLKEIDQINMVNYVPVIMKKYKDMTVKEKKETIHLLRLGKNPWRESYERNWQLQRISEDLDCDAHVYDIIRSYSNGRNDKDAAKIEIQSLQKEIAKEKAEVRASLRNYKPVIKIYEEMKKYEIRAYLYEFAGCMEYQGDYENYFLLTKRLQENYGKSIGDVAAFVENQNNALLYAKAQARELSNQYRAILRYEKTELNHRDRENVSSTLFEAVGHSKARTQAKEYGSLTTRLVYVAAEGVSDIRIRVLTTPDIMDGKPTVTTTVTVLAESGEALEEYSSEEMSGKEFNRKVNGSKYAYGFNKCSVFDSEGDASLYMEQQYKKNQAGSKRSK